MAKKSKQQEVFTPEQEQQLKEMRDSLYDVNDEHSKLLRDFTKEHVREGGLLPDNIRTSPEYRELKRDFDLSFKKLQDFNKSIPNSLKRQWSAERRKERMQEMDMGV